MIDSNEKEMNEMYHKATLGLGITMLVVSIYVTDKALASQVISEFGYWLLLAPWGFVIVQTIIRNRIVDADVFYWQPLGSLAMVVSMYSVLGLDQVLWALDLGYWLELVDMEGILVALPLALGVVWVVFPIIGLLRMRKEEQEQV